MPWFVCESCGDTLKKPKIKAHFNRCAAEAFSCIDCSATFDRRSVQNHVACVTEHEKYALGATKGAAGHERARAVAAEGTERRGGDGGETFGEEFLSTRPPWRCSCCGVSCTSEETLSGHASGKKHKSKARSARARAAGETPGNAETAEAVEAKATDERVEKKVKKEKKEKKGKKSSEKDSSDDGPKRKKAKK